MRIYTRRSTDPGRIFENQHLLDATEIFRKLNVHKKVRDATLGAHSNPAAFLLVIPE
jgi:hypothetical protein